MSKSLITIIVGGYVIGHYSRRVAQSGVAAVARQLRKQGFSLSIARLILLGKP